MTGKSIQMGRYLYRKKTEFDPNSGGYAATYKLSPENLSNQYQIYEISLKDRKSHTYIRGGTESGKSEIIKSLVYQHLAYEPDATQIIIDPEGGLAKEIAGFNNISEDDLLFVDSSNTMNILDSGGDPQAIIKVLSELLGEDERLTSRMKRVLHHCITVLILRPDSTLEDLIEFMDDGDNAELIAYTIKNLPDGRSRRFIEDKLNRIHASVREGIDSRIDGLLNVNMVEDFACGRSTFDLKEAIEDKKLIIFDLSDDDSYAVGRMVIARIVSLLKHRDKTEACNTVYLYVDEAHEYLTPEVSFILKRLRKRGVFLTLATQGRMGDKAIDEAIGENTGLTFHGRAYGRGEFVINNRGDEITLQCNPLSESCYISDAEWHNRVEQKKRLEHSTPKLLKNDVPPKLDPDQQAVIDALKERKELTAQDFLKLGIRNGVAQVNALLRTMKGDVGLIKEHKTRNTRGNKQKSTYTLS